MQIEYSNKIIAAIINKGKTNKTKFTFDNDREKPVKICSKTCPDIIFANNRIAKLKSLAICEINSIPTKKGNIKPGTSEGTNIL